MFDELRRQQALEELGILDTPRDERVDRVARLAKQMFGVPMVSVSLLDGDRQWRKSEIGLGGDEAPRQDSFCDYTVGQDRTVVIEDASATETFATNPFVVGDPHLRFYAGHPLHAPGGEPVGTLCVLDTEPHSFSEAQRGLLRDLAFWVQSEIASDVELDQATLIQSALRPQSIPTITGYTVAGGGASRGRLAGDFYDLRLHDGLCASPSPMRWARARDPPSSRPECAHRCARHPNAASPKRSPTPTAFSRRTSRRRRCSSRPSMPSSSPRPATWR